MKRDTGFDYLELVRVPAGIILLVMGVQIFRGAASQFTLDPLDIIAGTLGLFGGLVFFAIGFVMSVGWIYNTRWATGKGKSKKDATEE